MDDLDPKELEEETEEDEVDDVDEKILGGAKKKSPADEDSLDDLAEEEDAVLPEDEFDDKDLW